MEAPRWIRYFSDEDFRDYQQHARMYRGKVREYILLSYQGISRQDIPTLWGVPYVKAYWYSQ